MTDFDFNGPWWQAARARFGYELRRQYEIKIGLPNREFILAMHIMAVEANP